MSESEFHASSVDILHPFKPVRVSIETVQLILTNYCCVPQCVLQQEKILDESEELAESGRPKSISTLIIQVKLVKMFCR